MLFGSAFPSGRTCMLMMLYCVVGGSIKSSLWTSSRYIDLNCPLSPCVSMQWTIRDSCVVNLPCTLLVEGDVILLRPGQIVCVKCRRLKVCMCSSLANERFVDAFFTQRTLHVLFKFISFHFYSAYVYLLLSKVTDNISLYFG